MAIHPVTRTNISKYEFWFKPRRYLSPKYFYGHENGFMQKIFAICGRDFLIDLYKFMNALNRYRNLWQNAGSDENWNKDRI